MDSYRLSGTPAIVYELGGLAEGSLISPTGRT